MKALLDKVCPKCGHKFQCDASCITEFGPEDARKFRDAKKIKCECGECHYNIVGERGRSCEERVNGKERVAFT